STVPATSHYSSLSLHDALPIYADGTVPPLTNPDDAPQNSSITGVEIYDPGITGPGITGANANATSITDPGITGPGITGSTCGQRSEEHTSELQSHLNLVCRLLL